MAGRASWIFCGVVLVAGACDEGEEPVGFEDGEEVELRKAFDNSMYLNTMYLNTMYLNGAYLNTMYLNGPGGSSDYIRATEFRYDKATAQAVWLEGSQLFVRDAYGNVVSGAAMNKLKVKYDVVEGGVLKHKVIKINHAQQLSPGSDVWVYDLDLKVGPGEWAPLCVDGQGMRTQAILLTDVWSASSGDRTSTSSPGMTYACRGAALAKCVEWGYKPWAMAAGTSLGDFHQACSRMVRADYCGDGLAHTVNGTPIHVLDDKGVQGVDPNVSYVVEAEWDADGATCLNGANTRLANQNIGCQIPACGTSFASGGILQSGKIVSGP